MAGCVSQITRRSSMNRNYGFRAPRPSPMMRRLSGLILGVASPLALAGPPPTPLPPIDAGTILQQAQPVTPPPTPVSGTGLTIESESGANLPRTAPFLVRSLLITGNTRFDTPTLQALVADAEGQTLTLLELHERVTRITRYYQTHGYPLARAIIPQQLITAGQVGIQIIEARYGKVILQNSSQVRSTLLEATLVPLGSGSAVSQGALDHSLLLLSDLPGVAVNATLKPGEAVSTSDLVVDTTPLPMFSGSIAADDFGDRFTGRARLGGTVNVIDPLHQGDVFSASGLSSGSDMEYGRLAYDAALTGTGTRVGVSYSALHYKLGDPLSALEAHGTATVASLWAKRPIVRSTDVNLYGQIQYDYLKLDDHIEASALITDRHLNDFTASVSGDSRDAWLTGGVISWTASLTSGEVGFDNDAARLADVATVRTDGRYTKWNAALYRLQNIGPANTLYLTVSGQWANSNLDSSQKVLAGGPYTVRAYDMSAIAGDTGYQESVELRHLLAAAWHGRWQTLVFIDSAQVTINKNATVSGKNSATLSGAGVGLNWIGPQAWSVKTYLATPFGPTPVLVEDPSSVRLWVEFSKGF
jgi:hemolysin activation/secretion protein